MPQTGEFKNEANRALQLLSSSKQTERTSALRSEYNGLEKDIRKTNAKTKEV